MAIQREIWEDHIVEGLYKDNIFLTKSFNADSHVYGGKVVHIPQAGAPAGVVVDRSSLPATVVQRTDTDITYTMKEFTTDPTLIPNIDTTGQLSYDKRESVIGESQRVLNESVADWMLRNWAPAGASQIVRTTGGSRAGEVNASATGNRKKFTKEDILALQKKMNKAKIPKAGRVLLLPTEFLADLMLDTDLIKRDTSLEANLREGVLLRLFGFDIYERASVLTYTNAGTPVVKDPGAAGATTDNAAALAWHPASVVRSLGTVQMFQKIGDPTYYGDIYSFLVMSGGRIRRNDGLGVFAIVEDAA